MDTMLLIEKNGDLLVATNTFRAFSWTTLYSGLSVSINTRL